MQGGKPGVFLDRDGTLNHEASYITTPGELHLVDGAGKAVSKLNRKGIVTCVISNQSGVARGYLSEQDLIPIHAKLEHDLNLEGARIDRIYYCPHHPTAGIPPYNVDCNCRKPKPGMLLQGAEDLGIDLQRSFVVGDSVVDIQAGNAVHATTILVKTGYGERSEEQCRNENIPIAYVAPTIVEAVEYILDKLDSDT